MAGLTVPYFLRSLYELRADQALHGVRLKSLDNFFAFLRVISAKKVGDERTDLY